MNLFNFTNKNQEFNEMDYKAIANIKGLALDMINNANSGHPGIALSCAPIIYSIYAHHLINDPKNPKFINRDRFIMSAGHGSSLLYATLFMCGYNITIDDLTKFRSINSKTPGHPEYNLDIGVEMTTGPLGQGIASSVGFAIAEKFLNNRYLYKKDKSLIDHYTYVLVGDGDLMEGVSYEALSIAGNLSLGKLIVLYDSNYMTLDNDTKNTFKEDVLKRFEAMNWDTYKVGDGNNLEELNSAIERAKTILDKPSIIEVKTILGYGSKLENTNIVHGKPLDEEDIINIKKNLGLREIPFTVLQDAYSYVNDLIDKRVKNNIRKYESNLKKVLPNVKEEYKHEIEKLMNNDLSINISDLAFDVDSLSNMSGRDISHNVLNEVLNEKNLVMGGSCDVSSSTKVYLDNSGDFTNDNLSGRNILFGVREHAMGAILNGITLSGIRTFGSTFLTFSDYLKPSIRMAAMMKLPIIYIFTHDTVEIGEDGMTHQAVEQLVGLRSIPNVEVYRPYDMNEIIGSYKCAVNNLFGPSIIIISKDKIDTVSNTSINDVMRGAYIIKDYEDLDGVIISTGKEVSYALEVSNNLCNKGINLRVVSMPSVERFIKENKKYRDKILPEELKRIVIEFSSSYSWYRFIKDEECMFNVNNFGLSGNNKDILKEFNLDVDTLIDKIEKLFD